ncbi:MAG: hypothetical protein ABIG32_00410 [Candidatus Uhrbacteria bacterium]|nr:hypothetical protein [Patescibacteria group bacterium]MBU1907339.1 hypothetical protein [Patescibacteria group bacterium]
MVSSRCTFGTSPSGQHTVRGGHRAVPATQDDPDLLEARAAGGLDLAGGFFP